MFFNLSFSLDPFAAETFPFNSSLRSTKLPRTVKVNFHFRKKINSLNQFSPRLISDFLTIVLVQVQFEK